MQIIKNGGLEKNIGKEITLKKTSSGEIYHGHLDRDDESFFVYINDGDIAIIDNGDEVKISRHYKNKNSKSIKIEVINYRVLFKRERYIDENKVRYQN